MAAVIRVTTPAHMAVLHDAHFTRRYASRHLGTTTVGLHLFLLPAALALRLGCVNNLLHTHALRYSTVTMEHTTRGTENQTTVKMAG